MKRTYGSCVLLFSGGRDSTIAAVRLSRRFERLFLVTVTSEHLVGLSSVRRRLSELKAHLATTARWLHVIQPSSMPGDQLFRTPTCLPCHRSYTTIGAIMAKRLKADSVAFGYTRYQSAWPEQTPYAVERLTSVLASWGIKLDLPVYDIPTKGEAIAELSRYGLSTEALEQKCLRQQFNVELDASRLKEEIFIWEQSILQSMVAVRQIQIQTVSDLTFEDLC